MPDRQPLRLLDRGELGVGVGDHERSVRNDVVEERPVISQVDRDDERSVHGHGHPDAGPEAPPQQVDAAGPHPFGFAANVGVESELHHGGALGRSVVHPELQAGRAEQPMADRIAADCRTITVATA